MKHNAVGLSVTYLDYGSDMVTTVELPDGTGEELVMLKTYHLA